MGKVRRPSRRAPSAAGLALSRARGARLAYPEPVRLLPPIVVDHFRRPRHEGALPGAQAVGEVEGRRPDSRLRLHLKVGPGQRVAVGYECVGDRSCVAALSLVATLVYRKPLPWVEALTLETVASEYGLDAELHPQLVPAVEALAAALASLRGEASPFAAEGEVLCHCLHVRRGRIERAVRERGLRTFAEVRAWTRACTGCRSCRVDIEQAIADARRDLGS